MSSSVVISVQALDGTWERIGTGRSAGIVPENVQPSANEWLADTVSFTLKRNPGAVYPDLLAFTPVMISVNGLKVWAGRLEEQPTRDGSEPQISVTARGWQYHLDDDLYWPFFVHSRLADWKDIRSHPEANLATFVTACSVEVGEGMISLSYAQGVPTAGGGMAYFDAGEGRKIKRVVIPWEIAAGAANRALYFTFGDTIAKLTDGTNNQVIHTATGASSGTYTLTLADAARYVGVRYDANAHTPAADEWAKITAARLFSETAYESGNASVLTADQLVTNALDGCPSLLSTDTSGIEAQTFEIPEYAPLALQTPRTVIQAAKELEDALVQVDVDRRLIFKDRPQRPKFRVGAWSGAEFSDASAGSAAEIYNRILVSGTGPDGEGLTVERTAGEQSGAPLIALSSPAPDNPSFETNTTGWTATGSTITRDTGVYDSSPASGRWNAGLTGALETTFTGTFEAGVTYVLKVVLKEVAGAFLYGTFGTTDDFCDATGYSSVSFTARTFIWTPSERYTSGVTLRFHYLEPTPMTITAYFDSLAIFKAAPTLVDRRGFRRTAELPTGSALVEALGQQLGDGWLSNHRATPFRGDLEVSRGGVREVVGGREVEPSELLINVGELILFSNTVDPDTGAIGRAGRIVNVSYDADTDRARVSIDNESGRFSALLARVKERVG